MRNKEISLPYLIESFFTERLVQEKKVSPHTISSYRDTFMLLLQYVTEVTKKKIIAVVLEDLHVDCILKFLNYLEDERKCSIRTRNQRLAAIKAFFKHANQKLPDRSDLVFRVLTISTKRMIEALVDYLTREEATALLQAPDRTTWIGRRDHMMILFAIETGFRVSELINVKKQDLTLDHHPHVYCLGKGRKERRTPLGKATLNGLREWMKEQTSEIIFSNSEGGQMSPDTFQHRLKKYKLEAQKSCASFKNKRLSPHVLRHTAAMNLLHAGVDPATIALWLGHASLETILRTYLKASMKLKEAAVQKMQPQDTKLKRYKPEGDILSYLEKL